MPWPCSLEGEEGEGEVWAVKKKRGVRTQGHILLHHACVFLSEVLNKCPQRRVENKIIAREKMRNN